MKINLALAISKNWFEYARVAATSVLYNSNTKDDYKIFFLSNGFDESDKDYFNKLKKIRNVEIEFLTVDDDYFDGAIHDWLGVSASYRLRLQTLVNEPKILYIDADVIAFQDIAPFYATDISKYYLAAVEDKCSDSFKCRVGLDENQTFFNSGVQLINLDRFRKDHIEEKMLKKLREENYYTDQDVLNDICRKKILSMPLKYNIMYTKKLYKNREDERDEAIKNPVLYHFMIKPWNSSTDIDYNRHWYAFKDFINDL